MNLLPHVNGSGAVATVSVPSAAAHNVPDSCSAVLAAACAVIGVVEVGRAKVVAKLVTNNAEITHGTLAANLGLDGVAIDYDATHRITVNFATVRPNIGTASRHLLTFSLMENGETVENTIAIVVEIGNIDLVGYDAERLNNEFVGIFGIVESFVAVYLDPGRHSGFDVQLSVTLLEVIVAEGTDTLVVLLIHQVLEILLRVGGFRVVEVDEQEQKFAFAFGGKGSGNLQILGAARPFQTGRGLRGEFGNGRRTASEACRNASANSGRTAAFVAKGRGLEESLCVALGKGPEA